MDEQLNGNLFNSITFEKCDMKLDFESIEKKLNHLSATGIRTPV
jgi:hypothetical protein